MNRLCTYIRYAAVRLHVSVSQDACALQLERFDTIPVSYTHLYGTNGTNAIGASANGTGDFFNNRYQLNIRDKIKENVIKIVKVDSETGKQIPLKGTKIFIRYKGNPDLTGEENEKAFGPGGTV